MSDDETNANEVNKKVTVNEQDAPEDNVTSSDTENENTPANEHINRDVPEVQNAPKWNDHPVVTTIKQKYSHHYAVVAVLVILVVGFGAWAMMLSSDNKDLKKQVAQLNAQVAGLNANPQATVQKQTDDLINKVGQLMQLPAGETPTVAAVSDAAQAKQQSAFFANAQNGDKVLVYVKAGEAVLYRPSTNKIILVAPLTINNAAATTTPAANTTTKH